MRGSRLGIGLGELLVECIGRVLDFVGRRAGIGVVGLRGLSGRGYRIGLG